MNRSDLVVKLAEEKNFNVNTAEKIVLEIFSSMADTLIADDRIEIRGFGSFVNRAYDGRTGRNPMSGAKVTVASKNAHSSKSARI